MVSTLLINYDIYQVLYYLGILVRCYRLIFWLSIQINAGRKYSLLEWKEDMKQLVRRTGINMEKTVFLCNMAVLKKPIFLDYIARLICGYEIPDLFSAEERVELVEQYQKQTKENVTHYFLFKMRICRKVKYF